MEKYIVYSKKVEKALKEGVPVVALESTIISHGMPYPENVESARKCEAIIEEEGCVAATIAIIQGKVHIGLEDETLEYLGKTKGVKKVSRRDIPMILSQEADGATTVATTMYFASLAGIKIFATGGIGGVHRGAETSFDISADLEEFAITPVTVVCAGAKSILDIGLTLEYLETKGVPVIGYKTKEFPAFYTRTSGFQLEYGMDEYEIAKAMKASEEMGLRSGMIVANPIPKEYALEESEINTMIQEALKEAEGKIFGKEITPFLLDKIYRLSEGKSLKANKELVYHNTRIAAKIARQR